MESKYKLMASITTGEWSEIQVERGFNGRYYLRHNVRITGNHYPERQITKAQAEQLMKLEPKQLVAQAQKLLEEKSTLIECH